MATNAIDNNNIDLIILTVMISLSRLTQVYNEDASSTKKALQYFRIYSKLF